MRRSRVFALAAVSIALAAVAYRWTHPLESDTPSPPAAVTSSALEKQHPADAIPVATPQPASAPPSPLSMVSEPQNLLPDVRVALDRTSLRGTLADGEIRFGADGRLIVNSALRRHMEWWLSLIGEMPLNEIRQLLQRNLGLMEAGQASQVLAFFDRWVDYLHAADTLQAPGDTAQRLQQLSALRREWFGDKALALFGEEETYTSAVLARQQALSDPQLSPDERAAAVRAADEMLSDEQRQVRQASTDPLIASVQTQQFESLEVAPEQRYQEREAIWGAEAADRLAALDAERARWQARVDAFRAERAQVLADSSLDSSAQQARIAQILERDFNPAEARRARAMADIADREGR